MRTAGIYKRGMSKRELYEILREMGYALEEISKEANKKIITTNLLLNKCENNSFITITELPSSHFEDGISLDDLDLDILYEDKRKAMENLFLSKKPLLIIEIDKIPLDSFRNIAIVMEGILINNTITNQLNNENVEVYTPNEISIDKLDETLVQKVKRQLAEGQLSMFDIYTEPPAIINKNKLYEVIDELKRLAKLADIRPITVDEVTQILPNIMK